MVKPGFKPRQSHVRAQSINYIATLKERTLSETYSYYYFLCLVSNNQKKQKPTLPFIM